MVHDLPPEPRSAAMVARSEPEDQPKDLGVTSRKVVWLFLEQVRLEFVPVFHRLQGRLAAQCCLRQLLVVEPDVAVQRHL